MVQTGSMQTNLKITVPRSLLTYYQQNRFNPVPIALEDQGTWESHFAKRFNLYQRHLGIPLSLLRGRSVIEFGCNSGENALVLAYVGANLTLVEPNEQVFPRLKALFKKLGLEGNIVALLQEDINSFEAKKPYDVVIAEGFLHTLPNRDEMILKTCSLVAPGGFGVITFNCRYGCLLETTKQIILYRACQLEAVDDVRSNASLELAKQLYWSDFVQLNASRPFEVWWKDMLVNPFFEKACLWSYQELLPLIESAGCEFHSSSPSWALLDHFSWYKNTNNSDRHVPLLDNWSRTFPYFLTGLPLVQREVPIPPQDAIDAVADLVVQLSEYTEKYPLLTPSFKYPLALDRYLSSIGDPKLIKFNEELKHLYSAVESDKLDELLHVYHSSKCIRNLWGVPYHYLCFSKL